jgi:uncharacterized protein
MSIHILAQKNYRQKLWKNGRGITSVIALYPPDAEADFDWRVSMADIKESGPFSHFPGIDRVLVLLEGLSLIIQHPNLKSEHKLNLLQPYHFSGDIETFAIVQAEGIDFNVMTKRGKVLSNVLVEHLAVGELLEFNESFDHLLVFCCAGQLVCDGQIIGMRDTLQLEKEPALIRATENSVLIICYLNSLK